MGLQMTYVSFHLIKTSIELKPKLIMKSRTHRNPKALVKDLGRRCRTRGIGCHVNVAFLRCRHWGFLALLHRLALLHHSNLLFLFIHSQSNKWSLSMAHMLGPQTLINENRRIRHTQLLFDLKVDVKEMIRAKGRLPR